VGGGGGGGGAPPPFVGGGGGGAPPPPPPPLHCEALAFRASINIFFYFPVQPEIQKLVGAL